MALEVEFCCVCSTHRAVTTYSSDENTTHHFKNYDLHRAILLKGLTKIDETPILLLGRCGRFLPGHLSNSRVLRDVMLNHTAKNYLGVETMKKHASGSHLIFLPEYQFQQHVPVVCARKSMPQPAVAVACTDMSFPDVSVGIQLVVFLSSMSRPLEIHQSRGWCLSLRPPVNSHR